MDNQISPWSMLPQEVLCEIFSYVVAAEGSALPCLLKLRKVCRQWKYAADSTFIWTKLSFTPVVLRSERIFKNKIHSFEAFASRYFKHVQTLSCSGLEQSAKHIVSAVASHSDKIRDFSLLQCGCVTMTNCLQILINRHGKSIENFSVKCTGIKPADWKKCIMGLGDALKSLEVMRKEHFLGTPLGGQYGHLQNLVILKMSHNREFDLTLLKDLKKLKVLHLLDMILITNNSKDISWPELEDLDFQYLSTGVIAVSVESNQELVEIIGRSTRMKKVCLRGRALDIASLCNHLQLCNEIEHLDVTVVSTRTTCTQQGSLTTLVGSIGCSLTHLFIDVFENLDEDLQTLIPSQYNTWDNVTSLCMQRTNISEQTLKKFLRFCSKSLEFIDISMCRHLPRGCKRIWNDISKLKKFLKVSNIGSTH